MKFRIIWLLLFLLLTACGVTQNPGDSPTTVPVPTSVATAVPTPTTARPTATPSPPVKPTTIPTAHATAVPLLESITLVRISQSWSVVSTMLADATTQEAGEISPGKAYSQDIPFKVEGITLVAHVELSAENTTDGDVTGVLYSRSDRTQWIIPIVVTLRKSEGVFQVNTIAQNPANTLSRQVIPANLKMTIYR